MPDWHAMLQLEDLLLFHQSVGGFAVTALLNRECCLIDLPSNYRLQPPQLNSSVSVTHMFQQDLTHATIIGIASYLPFWV